MYHTDILHLLQICTNLLQLVSKLIFIPTQKNLYIWNQNLNDSLLYSQKIALIDVGYGYRMTVLVTKVGGSIP